MDYLLSLLNQFYPLASGLLSMLMGQFLKGIVVLFKDRRLHWSQFIGSGGMPSSHSAFVTGLSAAVGVRNGWNSSTFAICLVFAFIVFYDSAGVRYEVGQHGNVLNDIIDRSQLKGIKKVPIVPGHTPFEIMAGVVLGIGVAFVLFLINTGL